MGEKEITELFILLSVVAVSIASVLIILFVVFQSKKNKLLLKQKESEKQFEKEITNSKIEIREETFRNISWELHDNIGQLITLAKVQMQNEGGKQEVGETLSKALTELRSLSKQTNPDVLKAISFTTAIASEIDRFNRLNFLKANLKITGEEIDLGNKNEIVLFRILQEFFSNTVKHSKATKLNLSLNYKKNGLQIKVEDNGIGFDLNGSEETEKSGIGLVNIAKRAELIGASSELESSIGKGTRLIIEYIKANENI